MEMYKSNQQVFLDMKLAKCVIKYSPIVSRFG